MIAPAVVFAVVVLVGLRIARPRGRQLADASSRPARPADRRAPVGALRRRAHRWSIRWRRRHHITCSPAAVADWCDELARLVRSGASLREALADAVPADRSVSEATEPLRAALRFGASNAESIAALPTDRGPHLGLACQVIGVAARLGGSPAAAIDRTAVVLRQRAADGAERLAHAAQARTSAHVLTALPLVVLSILFVADPDVRAVLASSTGSVVVGVGLVLNLAGWCWMRHLVREPR